MLDHIDIEIIRLLQSNSRIQWKQVGEHIHMSAPAVASRVKRLEDMGVIEGFTIKLNEKLIGNTYCVFITVIMKNYSHTKFQEFIRTKPEIKEAHRVSGEPCFILKAIVPEHEQLARLLDEILVYGYYKINLSIGQIK